MFVFLAAHSASRRHRISNDSNAQKMDAMIQKGLSMRGHNTYTQSSKRTQVFSEPGYSDCSSFCWKMYEKFFGIYVGSWTGEQITKGKRVVKGSGGKVTSSQMSQFKKGDLLFYGVSQVKHVEMYIGNGQQLGHGSGMGPKLVNTLSYSHSGGFREARRYVDIGGGSSGGSSSSFTKKGTAKCTGNSVNIRSSAWGSVIGTAYKGDVVEYDGQKDGEFYHIRFNGVVGYMSEKYLDFGGSSSSSSSSFTVKGTCTCTGDDVNIRDGPNGNILTSVNKGTQLQYDGKTNGNWVHIKYGSIIGYIYKQYVAY